MAADVMRAAVLDTPGPDARLDVRDLPRPAPADDEVLIRVATVSVNHQDALAMRSRAAISHLPLPLILGNDPSGVVIGQGEAVSGNRIGERVVVKPLIACGRCASCRSGEDAACTDRQVVGIHRQGGMAEYVAISTGNAVAIPDGLGFAAATAISQSGPIAMSILKERAAITPDDVVLVSGAGGAVGSAALRIAAAEGAEVIAIVRGTREARVAQRAGASMVVDLDERPGFATDVTERFPDGVTVYAEIIGDPEVWAEATKTIAMNGRVVVSGAIAGPIVQLDLSWTFRKRVSILGLAGSSAAAFREALAQASRGDLVTAIDSTFDLTDVAAAFARLRSPEREGKVLIRVAEFD